jgi:exopolysaccharide biosynthesis protein
MIKHFFIKITLFLWIACIPSEIKGFSYEYISDGYFTSVHILTVDPKEHVILPVKASGEEIARETVATLAKSYGASAAVNGGFWKANGNPAGILKINCLWYGTPIKPRGAIGWSLNGQRVLIDRILTNYHLKDCPDESEIEVIPMSTPPHTSPEEWRELEHIVGGTPVLVRNGNVIEDYSPEQTLESFLVKKHPRTAVGIRDNGEWVFVVVDGRFYGFLGGMTIKELAELMLNLGCIEALNLDGGGSSTMVVEGIVINDPCGELKEDEKQVEAVSDAILIFPTNSL